MFEQSEGLAELTSAVAEGLTFSHPPLQMAKGFDIRCGIHPTADATERFKICLSIGVIGRERGPSAAVVEAKIIKASDPKVSRRPT